MSSTAAKAVLLGATGNANIGAYLKPELFVGILIFIFLVLAFLIGLAQMMALQGPVFYQEKSPNWGKVEENE